VKSPAPYEVLDVIACVRCGKNHSRVRFKRMASPFCWGTIEVLTHWALCPEVGDPILLGHRNIDLLMGRLERQA